MFIFEYTKILLFMVLSLGLSLVLVLLSFYISPKEYDAEKLSAYECGFTPLGDARQPFHVRFYLVGILFLLFDLEVIFLFPWGLSVTNLYSDLYLATSWSFFVVFTFLTLLTIGFIYEWKKGALDWE